MVGFVGLVFLFYWEDFYKVLRFIEVCFFLVFRYDGDVLGVKWVLVEGEFIYVVIRES